MKIKLVNKIFWVFPAVGFLTAGIAYPFLPAQLPTHWDKNGQPDQYWHKIFLFLIPLILAFCVFVFTWLPTVKTSAKNRKRLQRQGPFSQMLFYLVILAAEMITLLFSLGQMWDAKIIACMAVGMICAILGHLFSREKPNPSGEKTAGQDGMRVLRLGGKVWIAGGAVLMAIGLLPTPVCVGIGAATGGLMLFAPLVYGLIFRKKH